MGTTLRLLMAEPNPDDGLMAEITNLYKQNYTLFVQKATESTLKHATESFQLKPKATDTLDAAELSMKTPSLCPDESSSSSSSSSSSEDEGEGEESINDEKHIEEETKGEEKHNISPSIKRQKLN